MLYSRGVREGHSDDDDDDDDNNDDDDADRLTWCLVLNHHRMI